MVSPTRICCLVTAAGALACKTTASPFFGVPWRSAFAMYSTENGWKRHGGVSKINLYYNKKAGCLTGLRITYGNQVRVVTQKAQHLLTQRCEPATMQQPK
jgi:hypothetical protein